MFSLLQGQRNDLWFEWRPDGVSASTYYEIRGPAAITPTYRWVVFSQARTMVMEVEIPIAPLSRGATLTQSSSSMVAPIIWSVPSTVPGTAPAQANFYTYLADQANWALIAWWKRATTPLSGSVAPVGIIQAEAGSSLSGWTVVSSDATYMGSSGLRKVLASEAFVGTATHVLDPSVIEPDDYMVDSYGVGEAQIEVWARVALNASNIQPTFVISLEPNTANMGLPQYSAEYGSTGKAVTKPLSGDGFRFTRLGTLTMPVDKTGPLKWNLKVTGRCAAGSSGRFGYDYLILVPLRSRCLGPTGKPLDSSYPRFIQSPPVQKMIRADLSG
jgi:hypothetical protein